ncbi:hypothetical protein H4R34_003303 [Dimargaris verticillata]|uniref:Vaculolar membrane protein-domain-containing protein n=1 Tax=Dimargaris verticillata TaxID=2761393 RepID=A0A9W8EC52_9FUNG|nr:hypothetical protein H4R34_003303 [Dimargaris verticillata]
MDSFAIFIQTLLGVIAISTLFLKRQREVPQRPFVIWFFDVSKQATGSAMMHMLNLLAAHLSGKSSMEDSNPCVWYFMNLILDTTVGVYILYLYLKLIHAIVRTANISGMDSGNYGTPPRVTSWIKQSIAFFVALLTMKMTVMVALALFPFLAILGRIFLAPFKQVGDSRIQIVMVMLIVPLVMNIIQFWLIDHVIKQKHQHKIYIPAGGDDDADGDDQLSDENDTLYAVVTDITNPIDPTHARLRTVDDSPCGTDSPHSDTALLANGATSSHNGSGVRTWSSRANLMHIHASQNLSRSGSSESLSSSSQRYEMNKPS